ncbi:MAG: MFS transporter [Bacteroidales bacterium]|nr:MFS transporter [Bacteroidales bacterium]
MNKRQVFILLAMSLAVFMFCIEYTGIVIIIPAISQSLFLNTNEIQWSVIGYLLSFAVFIIISGRLGDIYGNRLVLIYGVVLFALASLLGGFSINAWQIILARVLQGLGAALLWPNTTAIVFNSSPENKKALAIGIITGVIGFSMAIGPLLAGYLSAIWDWRLFFFINIPLALIIIAVTCASVKTSKSNEKKTIDHWGLLLLILGLGCLMLGISYIKIDITTIFSSLLLILIGLLFLKKFLSHEKKSSYIMLDSDLIKNNNFILGCTVRATTNAAFYVIMFIMGLYLHLNLGYSTLKTGIMFLPMTLMIGFFSPIAGKLIDRYSELLISSIGLLFFIISYFAFALLQHFLQESRLLILLFLLLGIGYGFSSPGLLTFTMHTVEKKNTGAASGLFYMSSVLGSSIGVSIATIILSLYHSVLSKAFTPIMFLCVITASIGLLILIKIILLQQKQKTQKIQGNPPVK